MKTFCVYIQEAFRKKLDLKVSVCVSKKKKFVHFGFEKCLLSYDKSDEILAFIFKQWSKKKMLFENCEMIYHQLITFIHWNYDYVIFRKKENGTIIMKP